MDLFQKSKKADRIGINSLKLFSINGNGVFSPSKNRIIHGDLSKLF